LFAGNGSEIYIRGLRQGGHVYSLKQGA
jgi:hypothetical protein